MTSNALLHSLAVDLADDVARRYRIDAHAAVEVISERFRRDPALCRAAAMIEDGAKLRRTRAYKQAADLAKAELYHRLRRYRGDDATLAEAVSRLARLGEEGFGIADPLVVAARDEIAALHVSTRERMPDIDAFLASLAALGAPPSSVLDIGCGVQPLLYPFGEPGIRFLGLDRDKAALAAVAAWSRFVPGLQAVPWSLADGFDAIDTGGMMFDLALALKFVPVAARQEREHLAVLRTVPARRLLVTGAREAMVKRRSIARREEQVLRAFAADQGFVIAAPFETPSELGFLLERA